MPESEFTTYVSPASRAEPPEGVLDHSRVPPTCIHGKAISAIHDCDEYDARTRDVARGDRPAQPSTILDALEEVAKWDGLSQYIAGDNRSRLIVVADTYISLYPTQGAAKVLSNWEAVQWLTWNLRRHTPADEVCPSCKREVPEGVSHMSDEGLQRLSNAINEDFPS